MASFYGRSLGSFIGSTGFKKSATMVPSDTANDIASIISAHNWEVLWYIDPTTLTTTETFKSPSIYTDGTRYMWIVVGAGGDGGDGTVASGMSADPGGSGGGGGGSAIVLGIFQATGTLHNLKFYGKLDSSGKAIYRVVTDKTGSELIVSPGKNGSDGTKTANGSGGSGGTVTQNNFNFFYAHNIFWKNGGDGEVGKYDIGYEINSGGNGGDNTSADLISINKAIAIGGSTTNRLIRLGAAGALVNKWGATAAESREDYGFDEILDQTYPYEFGGAGGGGLGVKYGVSYDSSVKTGSVGSNGGVIFFKATS